MSQKETVLRMLKEGPKTTADFLQAYIPRFSARILDLKKDGIEIESRRVREGSYQYQLKKSFDGGLF